MSDIQEDYPEGWPTRRYDLPGGAKTNFPPGIRGHAQETEFCLFVQRHAEMGYGRMIQIIHRIWNTQDAAHVDPLDVPPPAGEPGGETTDG